MRFLTAKIEKLERFSPVQQIWPLAVSITLLFPWQPARRTESLQAFSKLPAQLAAEFSVVLALGNGFILTAMLWGAMGAHLADRHLLRAAAFTGICSLFSLFGVIHSVDPSGGLYLPWHLSADLPFRIAAGYAALGLLLVVFWAVGTKERAIGEAE